MELLAIAGPTVAAMTSYTVMTFTDKWLVSRLGADYVGGQGNGGLAAWVPQSLCYGVLGVVNTFVSQHQGAGQPRRGPAYAWNGAWLAIFYWLVVLVPYSFFLPRVFALADVAPAQAEQAAIYGRILVLGSILNLLCRAFENYFYGMHRPGVVLLAGVSANIINLFVSAILVFGNGPVHESLGLFGRVCHGVAAALNIAPMGIAGSAYGTVFATACELAIPLAIFLSRRSHLEFATRDSWRPSRERLAELLRVGWPAALMFGNEMICWAFFMIHLVSHFGTAHATAGWIAHQYMSLSFMPAVGISVATTAIVGKYCGMGRQDIAAARFWLALKLAAGYMGLCGVIFVVFRRSLISLFIETGTPPETFDRVVELGSMMLIATACFQLFDAACMTTSGALRGAGDTVVPGVATVVLSWAVIVGGGFFMIRFFPGLESIGPWIAAASYITLLCVVLVTRFVSGKWREIRLVDRPAEG